MFYSLLDNLGSRFAGMLSHYNELFSTIFPGSLVSSLPSIELSPALGSSAACSLALQDAQLLAA